jgi:uncharacterized protein
MPDAALPYPIGAPCWIDLLTARCTEVVGFYESLLGWAHDPDDPGAQQFTVFTVRGRPVAGIGEPVPGQPPSPAAWTTYFATDDLDASAERVTANGGTVILAPGQVGNAGRLALAADPAGLRFGLWQPGTYAGFGLTGEPGAAVWFELLTPDGKGAARFYAAVLGIPAAPLAQLPDRYWTLSAGGPPVAGIWHDSGELGEVPPRWEVYFQVPDTDAAVAAAQGLGALVAQPGQDSPFGRLARLVDPVGARFTVIAPPAG